MKLSAQIKISAFAFLAALLMGLQGIAATHTIIIENMKFNPEQIEIHKGDVVVWQNKDIVPHTVTEVKKKFDSGEIAPGKSWKKKFKSEAQFSYQCLYHPVMKAKLTIQR